ncbi:MAG: thiamine pyrophosphate-dependent enzyme [Acidobacteriaceae bacterium]
MASKKKGKAATPVTAETHENPLISNNKLKQLYSSMLQCRMLDERVQALARKKKVAANYRSTKGLEAMLAAMLIDLLPQDTLSVQPGDQSSAFLKGLPLKAIFGQLYAAQKPQTAKSFKMQGDPAADLNLVPTASAPVQSSLATGVALGNKQGKTDAIVLAFAGDATTALDTLQEPLGFASRNELPILYVTESSADKEPEVPFPARAHAYGMPGITVDGYDVIAVYRVAQEAIGHARCGLGPTLVECITSAQPLRAADDPIARMERHLEKKRLFSAKWKQQVISKFQKELDKAIAAAEKQAARK